MKATHTLAVLLASIAVASATDPVAPDFTAPIRLFPPTTGGDFARLFIMGDDWTSSTGTYTDHLGITFGREQTSGSSPNLRWVTEFQSIHASGTFLPDEFRWIFGTASPAMKISSDGKLILTGVGAGSVTHTITLDSAGSLIKIDNNRVLTQADLTTVNTVTIYEEHVSFSLSVGSGAQATGENSLAVGEGSKTVGSSTVAMGHSADAEGENNIAIGAGSISSGLQYSWWTDTTLYGSIALGAYAQATGAISTAIGPYAVASGAESVAFGSMAAAQGASSIALGWSGAYAASAISFGDSAVSYGIRGTAIGSHSEADREDSTAIGPYTIADGFGQTVVGCFSSPVGNQVSATEPTSEVFVVGSGSSTTTRANAMSVKRNGNTWIRGSVTIDGGPDGTPAKSIVKRDMDVQGVLRVRPAGDVDMGLFQTGAQP